MTPNETDQVVREVRIRAERETVFAYFTDPARMVEWFGESAILDPRPGGVYRVKVTPTDTAVGSYVEVDPPSRVVFRFGWEGGELVPPGTSTVEVVLTEDGDATIVRLTHRDLPVASVDKHGEGWAHYLDQLVLTLTRPVSVETQPHQTT